MRLPLIASVLVLTALAFFAATLNIDAKASRLADEQAESATGLLRAQFDANMVDQKARIAALEASNQALHVKLSSQTSAQSQIEKDLANAQAEVQVAREAAETKHAKYAAAQSQLKAVKVEMATAKAAPDLAAVENRKLLEKLDLLDSKNASLQQGLIEAKTTISNLSESVQEGREEKTSLEKQLADLKSEIDQSAEQVPTLEIAAASARQEVVKFAAEIVALEKTVRSRDSALLAAEERISALSTTLEQESQKSTQLSEKVNRFDNEITGLKAEIAMAITSPARQSIPAESVVTFSDDVKRAIEQCNAQTSSVFASQQIMFEDDSDALSMSSIPQLEELAGLAIDCGNNNLALIIAVRARTEGDKKIDDQLGNDRASAVRNFLGTRGFSRSAVRVVGYAVNTEPGTENGDEIVASAGEIAFYWEPL